MQDTSLPSFAAFPAKEPVPTKTDLFRQRAKAVVGYSRALQQNRILAWNHHTADFSCPYNATLLDI